MKKALPWIIGIACILLLYAMTLAGWLWSILTIAINVGVLFGLYWMFYKSNKATVRNAARILSYVIMTLSVCLMFVGFCVGIAGLADGETYTEKTKCAQCDGDGAAWDAYLGEHPCGRCGGNGFLASESYKINKMLFSTGMLMAASGAVLFFGALMIKRDASKSPDIPFAPMSTDVGDLTMMLGHWVEKDPNPKTWISNEMDADGIWTMRCRISNKAEKTINDLLLTVSLYDDAGQAVVKKQTYHAARLIKSGEIHTLWWALSSCPKTALAKGVLESAKIQFADGTIRCFGCS